MKKESDSFYQPRPLEPHEFLAEFETKLHRLDRHIVAVGNNERGARDDLAGLLRTLLNDARGDDAIARYCSLMGVPEPRVYLSKADPTIAGLRLQVAGLPTYDPGDLSVTVPSGLRSSICLLKHDGKKLRQFTWSDIVENYGNTHGAHLGQTVPRMLDEVRLHGLGTADFGTYMLRTLAVQISSVCHSLLKQRNPAHTIVAHDRYFQGVEVLAVNFKEYGTQRTLEARVSRQKWLTAGAIVSVLCSDGARLVFGTDSLGRLTLRELREK